MRRIQRRYPTVWNVLIDVGVVGLLIYFVVLLAAVRATQVAGVVARDAATASQDQIIDCVDPDGDCFRAGQRRTSQAVSSINEISIYAAYCADRPGDQTVAQIQQCVIHRLTAHQQRG